MYPYHVTYFYLATGMEGHADTRDYGIFYANSEDEAKNKAIIRNHHRMSPSDAAWLKNCLTAKRSA
jgi:hypothetical protein